MAPGGVDGSGCAPLGRLGCALRVWLRVLIDRAECLWIALRAYWSVGMCILGWQVLGLAGSLHVVLAACGWVWQVVIYACRVVRSFDHMLTVNGLV